MDAAIEEFGHYGRHGASLDRIVRAAGCTTGALYGHFRSKEDLYLAVYAEVTARITGEVGALAAAVDGVDIPAPEPGPRPAARRKRRPIPVPDERGVGPAADAWLAWHRDDPRPFRLNASFLLDLPDDPGIRAEVVAQRRRLREVMAAWVEDIARRRGRRLVLPADEVAVVLHALAIGMVLEQIGDPEAVSGRFGVWFEAVLNGLMERDR
jgi:AcrR family transcriptional regulator